MILSWDPSVLRRVSNPVVGVGEHTGERGTSEDDFWSETSFMQQLWTKGYGAGVGTITQPTCSFLGGMETHRKKTKELDGWQLTEVSSRGLENNTVFDFILTFMDRQ